MDSEQSTGPADPQGIDQQLDAGVAADDHLGDDPTEDLQPGTVTDPDDPEEGIRKATEESEHPS
jgi:hypothetical protein